MSSDGVAARAEASLPPHPLPGLDPAFSRVVHVPVGTGTEGDGIGVGAGAGARNGASGAGGAASASGVSHGWHVLDNGAALAARGIQPRGTILCVHGNPTWSYLWRELVSAAAERAERDPANAWRVVAVDQLDMGFSERTGTVRPLATRIADLSALTRELGIEDGPVVTLGHDWGGVVSLGWAVQHRESLAAVMLLNTAVHQPEHLAIPAPLRLALRRSLLERSTVATPAFLETTLALAHPRLDPAVRDAFRAPYRGAARRAGIGGFVADIPVSPEHRSFAALDAVAEGIRSLHVPAVMLWGPRDPVFGDQYLADLITRLPQADVHRFEGTGHLIAEDVNYAPVLLDWLASKVPAGAGDPDASVGPAASPDRDAADAGSRSGEVTAPFRPMGAVLDELRASDRTALVEMAPRGASSAPRSVSWRLLSRRVTELAAGLSASGVRPGDRVSLLVPPGADLTAVLYACLRIGAVVVVADAGLGLAGLGRAVRGARPDHLIGIETALAAARLLGWPGQRFSATTLAPPVAAALGVRASLPQLAALGAESSTPLPEAPGADDTAAILFTSGSTGPAKGVVYTHRQLAAMRDALAAQYGIGAGTGLVAGFAPFALLGPALGATSVTPDMTVTRPGTLTATAVAAAAAAANATVLFASPAALTNVVATAASLDAAERGVLASVRTLLSAGAPLGIPLLERVAELLPNATVSTPYGMTEGLLLTDISLDEIRSAARQPDEGVCVGAPAASVRLRVSPLDELGEAVGSLTDEPGVTGEIVASAPHIKERYDRLWITDTASKRDSAPERRWHRTGDVGHFDAAGRLWVEGRLPHVLVTADGPLTPVGPEQRIETLPAVARAALVGVGPRGTQQAVAVIETRDAARRVVLAPAELTAEIRHVTGIDVAAALVVRVLPTDIRHNSKIDRAALSRWAAGILAGGPVREP
ncbi:alpha/beta fold hydrolase [Planctomonas psychrotolerans]|uniref:alpha/beta fold hydrolase n=1 Tax=Planctomonas psychrotolerans TaxID=2528712 RepID=UPI001D0D54A2|nr:alpha/beta fold hydrolase [Planctomonas psychrotolerans]